MKLIFDYSKPGKEGFHIDEEKGRETIPQELLRGEIEELPEVSEREVVSHYLRLSVMNYSVDWGFYPLGSCTMKYNPKVNEAIANYFTHAHPLLPEELVQGYLKIFKELEEALREITGLYAFTLAPSAGAHGEFTGIITIRNYLEDHGERREIVLIPDSAHGTNPASATLAGYKAVEIPSDDKGMIDMDKFKEALNEKVAALMITNPNTLGIFEAKIRKIADLLHRTGAFLYMDGANMNALLGQVKVADLGVDVIHLNLHKTFSTPHGGGGPGSGPVGAVEKLAPYLPGPHLEEKEGILRWKDGRGRIRSFFGNFLVLVKALAYIRELGGEGLKEVSEVAVLNSRYLRRKLEGKFKLAYPTETLHEFVLSDESFRDKISTLDLAKRLLDYGFHPPTIYFPLIVHGALMVEPTETESKETLDQFARAMEKILEEAEENPEIVKTSPHKTPVGRLNEVEAARRPILTWQEYLKTSG